MPTTTRSRTRGCTNPTQAIRRIACTSTPASTGTSSPSSGGGTTGGSASGPCCLHHARGLVSRRKDTTPKTKHPPSFPPRNIPHIQRPDRHGHVTQKHPRRKHLHDRRTRRRRDVHAIRHMVPVHPNHDLQSKHQQRSDTHHRPHQPSLTVDCAIARMRSAHDVSDDTMCTSYPLPSSRSASTSAAWSASLSFGPRTASCCER